MKKQKNNQLFIVSIGCFILKVFETGFDRFEFN